jgi:hypothetical protein
VVFVEDAADPIAPDDAEVIEVHDVVWERFERCGLAEGSVGPMFVVEELVFVQDAA